MTLMFCFIAGTSNATVETWNPDEGSGTIGPGGSVQ